MSRISWRHNVYDIMQPNRLKHITDISKQIPFALGQRSSIALASAPSPHPRSTNFLGFRVVRLRANSALEGSKVKYCPSSGIINAHCSSYASTFKFERPELTDDAPSNVRVRHEKKHHKNSRPLSGNIQHGVTLDPCMSRITHKARLSGLTSRELTYYPRFEMYKLPMASACLHWLAHSKSNISWQDMCS